MTGRIATNLGLKPSRKEYENLPWKSCVAGSHGYLKPSTPSRGVQYTDWLAMGAESGEWIGGFKAWWGEKPQTSSPGGAGVWDDKGRGLACYLNSFFPSFVHFPLLVLLSQVSHPPGGWVQGSGSSRLITLLTRGQRASP